MVGKIYGALLKLRRKNLNNGKLKPGQLCWLTFTIPQNIGKIVEVIAYLGEKEPFGDVYGVKSRDPLLTETFDMAGNSLHIFKLTHECPVMRKQLVPINDPDLDCRMTIDQIMIEKQSN
jgi:hypothetical protein